MGPPPRGEHTGGAAPTTSGCTAYFPFSVEAQQPMVKGEGQRRRRLEKGAAGDMGTARYTKPQGREH